MQDNHITMTREELYQLVWTEPRSQLAKKLGISDVGLAKRCRKLNIPMPAKGDWAKIQSGHVVLRPQLKPLTKNETIEFITPNPNTPKPDKVYADFQALGLPDTAFTVADTLHGAHQLVSATRVALKGVPKDKYGRIQVRSPDLISMNLSPVLLNRALRIADRLIKTICLAGGKIAKDPNWDKGVVLNFNGVDLNFSFEETSKRKERDLTPQELKNHREFPSLYPAVAYDWIPSGILTFKINDYLARHVQHSWSDHKGGPLENLLKDVVFGIFVAAENKKIQLQLRAEEERKWQEQEKRREEAERIRREEKQRLRALIRESHLWALSEKVLAYTDAVEKVAVTSGHQADNNSKLGIWLIWARRQAEDLNPIRN